MSCNVISKSFINIHQLFNLDNFPKKKKNFFATTKEIRITKYS